MRPLSINTDTIINLDDVKMINRCGTSIIISFSGAGQSISIDHETDEAARLHFVKLRNLLFGINTETI